MRLQALRGAITVESNESGAILSATEELVLAVLERNKLRAEDLVSCIFTATDDLDAEFPAVAARRIGLDGVPLLCSARDPRARLAAARDPPAGALLPARGRRAAPRLPARGRPAAPDLEAAQ